MQNDLVDTVLVHVHTHASRNLRSPRRCTEKLHFRVPRRGATWLKACYRANELPGGYMYAAAGVRGNRPSEG
jgi:hypothetical protein